MWDVGTAVCAPITDPPLYADTFALTPDMNKLVILQKREEGKSESKGGGDG